MAQSSTLRRLTENTIYHYDAAYFYEEAAATEIPIDPDLPPVVPPEGGATRDAPSMRFTEEEITELTLMSETHLIAAIQLDDVIAMVQETTGEEIEPPAMAALEARRPKRGSGELVLRTRLPHPPGRPFE